MLRAVNSFDANLGELSEVMVRVDSLLLILRPSLESSSTVLQISLKVSLCVYLFLVFFVRLVTLGIVLLSRDI